MNTVQQLKYGTLISYAGILFNIGVGILYTPWMISSIGKADYGLYTLAMSVIAFFVMDFGLNTAVTRFTSNYLAKGEASKIKNMLGLVFKLYVFLDVIILLALIVFYFFIPSVYAELTPAEIDKFKVVFCIVAAFSCFSFPFIPLTGVLIAYERFIELKSCDLIQKVLTVGLMSICLLMGKGLFALVLVNAIAGLLGIAFKLIVYQRLKTGFNINYYNKEDLRSIIGFSGWTTVVAFAQRMIMTLAPSILGMFSGSESIAVLGIVISLESYVYTYASAINGMLLPKVSRVLLHDNQSIMPLMIKVGRLQILMIGIVFWGFIVLGRDFIQLWLGSGFEDVYLCTVLLIIPSFITLPQDIAVQAMNVLNYMKQMAIIYVVASVVNIVLALVLAKLYSVIGISISIFVAYMIRTIGLDIVFYRKMHLDMPLFFKETFGKMTIAAILAVALGFGVSMLISFHGIWAFLLRGVVFCLLFFISNYFLAMNDYEKGIIMSRVRKLYIRTENNSSNES